MDIATLAFERSCFAGLQALVLPWKRHPLRRSRSEIAEESEDTHRLRRKVGLVRYSTCRSPVLVADCKCLSGLMESRRHIHAPLSTAKLLFDHPQLLSWGTLSHPRKLFAFLGEAEVGLLSDFCAACPPRLLASVFPELLRSCGTKAVCEVLAACLVNTKDFHASVIFFLENVDLDKVTEIVGTIDAGALDDILKSPIVSLVKMVNAVEKDRIREMMLIVRHNPSAITDLMMYCARIEHAAAVVNHIDPDLVLWLFSKVEPERVGKLLDAFDAENLAPDGSFIRFLTQLEGKRDLVYQYVVPFLHLVAPGTVVQVINSVEAGRLLYMLRKIGAPGVGRILMNTNVDLIVTIWNSQYSFLITHGGKPLAHLHRNANTSATIKQVTDVVNATFNGPNTLSVPLLWSATCGFGL